MYQPSQPAEYEILELLDEDDAIMSDRHKILTEYYTTYHLDTLKKIIFEKYPLTEVFPELHTKEYLTEFLQLTPLGKILFATESSRAKDFVFQKLGCSPRLLLEATSITKYKRFHIKDEYQAAYHFSSLMCLLNFMHDWHARGFPMAILLELLKNTTHANRLVDNEEEFKFLFDFCSGPEIITIIKNIVHDQGEISDLKDIYEPLYDYPQLVDQVREIPFRERNSIPRLHDCVMNLAQKVTTPQIELNQLEAYPELQSLLNIKFSNPQLKVCIPRDSTELMDWGQKLNICVGTYANTIIRRHTTVIGIKKDGVITYCIELRTFRQMRRLSNSRRVPQGEAENNYPQIIQFKGKHNSVEGDVELVLNEFQESAEFKALTKDLGEDPQSLLVQNMPKTHILPDEW